MISALAASGLFLISYVIYKLNSGFAKFGGEGSVRYFYFSLFVHSCGRRNCYCTACADHGVPRMA